MIAANEKIGGLNINAESSGGIQNARLLASGNHASLAPTLNGSDVLMIECPRQIHGAAKLLNDSVNITRGARFNHTAILRIPRKKST